MTRFDTLHGFRVVAQPTAIDGIVAGLPAPVVALRLAPDDLFLTGVAGPPSCPDTHAIIEPEAGYSGSWFTRSEFEASVRPHMEWQMPSDGRLGQGFIAGVPSKVHVAGATVLVVCPTAFVHELEGRIG